MNTSSRRTVLWVFLGSLLVQIAWIAAVPPFRGIDEFDHAYRADAVAHGHWEPSTVAPKDGRGGVLQVRRSIVEAAGPMCASYEYTGPDNCRAIHELDGEMVSVASGAAGYHPWFYSLIGYPALIADGTTALYIMRGISALLCSFLLGVAFYLASLTARTIWLGISVFAGMTPVVMYSATVPAPNGLEILAGVVVWIALLGLTRVGDDRKLERKLIVWATIAAVILATLRQLGPLWLLLIGSMVTMLAGFSWSVSLARRHAVLVTCSLAGTLLATLGSIAWVVWSGTLAQGESTEVDSPILRSMSEIPVWIMQSVAAFPLRNEPAPVAVYAIYAVVGIGSLGVSFVAATRRMRFTLLATITASIAVPLLITVATIDTLGTAWQGRYTLPFSAGVVLLGGLAIDRRPPKHGMTGPGVLVLACGLGMAHVISVVNVAVTERRNPIAVADPLWPVMPVWLIGCTTILGIFLWILAFAQSPSPARLLVRGKSEQLRDTESDPAVAAN